MPHTFIDPENLDRNPPKKNRISRTVCEITDYTFFFTRPRKDENGDNLWTQRSLAEILLNSDPLSRQWDLTLGVFLEIIALQKCEYLSILTLTYIFSRWYVTQIGWPALLLSFWWKFDENRLNNVGYIQHLFCVSQVTHFLPEKWRLSCAATLKERNLRHSTGNVEVHIDDFFSRILASWEHTFTQIGNTQKRSKLMTKGKNLGDLPNKNMERNLA